MKGFIVERLNDDYINLFEEGIFIRCFEYSSMFAGELTGYRVFANIDKKTGFIFLELGFPKTKKQEILSNFSSSGYGYRLFDKSSKLVLQEEGSIKLNKSNKSILDFKKELVKFE